MINYSITARAVNPNLFEINQAKTRINQAKAEGKQGGSEEISKKMRNFVGSFDCIDKPNMPCGGHLNCKNNDLPSFSASQEPISSTR
jgi:hypothetical protein